MKCLLSFAIAAALACVSMSASAQKQSRADAQAAGLSMGDAALKSGPLNPGALSSNGTAQGSNNVWGQAYTGKADSKQTGKLTSPSMIGIGNEARTEASQSFKGYNSDRDGQALQSTYFLDRNPVLKPTLNPSDPLFNTSNLKDSTFASSTTKTCSQVTRPSSNVDKMEHSCMQTYEDYVVSCVSKPIVSITKQTCVPGSTQQLSSSTGGRGDGFNGGDIFNISWICKGAEMPDIYLFTNGPGPGYSVTLPSVAGGVTEGVSVGNQAVKFINETSCNGFDCTGTYTMILGTMQAIYGYVAPGCYPDPYSGILVQGVDGGESCDYSNSTYQGYGFVEQNFGKGSRWVTRSNFSIGTTQVSTNQTDDCDPYRSLTAQ